MCSQPQLERIIQELIQAVETICGARLCEAILFGSYARQDADDESDIDVMLLMDIPREELVQYRRALAEIAGALLCEHHIVVSPVMENADFFARNKALYPFFRNIDREGVRYAA